MQKILDKNEKKISGMFDSIASKYDRMNHLMSLGIDRIWRRRALREILDPDAPQRILDVACGTGDFSLEMARISAMAEVGKAMAKRPVNYYNMNSFGWW